MLAISHATFVTDDFLQYAFRLDISQSKPYECVFHLDMSGEVSAAGMLAV